MLYLLIILKSALVILICSLLLRMMDLDGYNFVVLLLVFVEGNRRWNRIGRRC